MVGVALWVWYSGCDTGNGGCGTMGVALWVWRTVCIREGSIGGAGGAVAPPTEMVGGHCPPN